LIDSIGEIIADPESENEHQPRDKAKLDKSITPFTVILDDPTGNSFIEFKDAMSADHNWNLRTYNRTREQNIELGLAETDDVVTGGGADTSDSAARNAVTLIHANSKQEASDAALSANEEIFVFPGVCSSCGRDLDTMMKKVAIPYFKVCRHV
jgi:zinc finger protein